MRHSASQSPVVFFHLASICVVCSVLCRNEVVLPFLWGMGEEGQLHYRVLPVEQYSNIREWQAQLEWFPVASRCAHRARSVF